MIAYKLISAMGSSIVGRRVYTQRVGAYPGGPATVVEICPDPNAPEIVCTVHHDTWRGDDASGLMGILSLEELILIPEEAAA